MKLHLSFAKSCVNILKTFTGADSGVSKGERGTTVFGWGEQTNVVTFTRMDFKAKVANVISTVPPLATVAFSDVH